MHLVSIHVVHPYSSMDTTDAWKELCFILLDRSDFFKADNLLITVRAFASNRIDVIFHRRNAASEVGELVH